MQDNQEPNFGKWVLIAVGAFVLITIIGVGMRFFGGAVNLEYRKTFEPANEKVSREVYTQTPSFIYGKTSRLSTLCGQVIDAQNTGDDGHKSLLYSQIKVEMVDFDASALTDQSLSACLKMARSQ